MCNMYNDMSTHLPQSRNNYHVTVMDSTKAILKQITDVICASYKKKLPIEGDKNKPRSGN